MSVMLVGFTTLEMGFVLVETTGEEWRVNRVFIRIFNAGSCVELLSHCFLFSFFTHKSQPQEFVEREVILATMDLKYRITDNLLLILILLLVNQKVILHILLEKKLEK